LKKMILTETAFKEKKLRKRWLSKIMKSLKFKLEYCVVGYVPLKLGTA